MPRAHSWQSRVHDILTALDNTAVAQLSRSDVEMLFGLGRRAALRLMQTVGNSEQNGEWRLDREALLQWLTSLASEVSQEGARAAKVRQAMHDAVTQKRQMKAELRRLGRPEPTTWTVPPEAFSAQVGSLPPEIVLTSGRVTVSFSPNDPTQGAKLLHLLSLAMLSDWEGFCCRAGGRGELGRQEQVETLLATLEEARLEGLQIL